MKMDKEIQRLDLILTGDSNGFFYVGFDGSTTDMTVWGGLKHVEAFHKLSALWNYFSESGKTLEVFSNGTIKDEDVATKTRHFTLRLDCEMKHNAYLAAKKLVAAIPEEKESMPEVK